MRHSCLPLFFMSACLSFAHERENTAISTHPEVCHHNHGGFVTGLESRYFAEGRDNLDGDALWVNSMEYNWESFSLGAWYATSPEQSYDELQLSAAWHQQLATDLEAYVGYTHLRFPSDDEHDNELGIGLAYTGCPLGVEYALDAYHSFEADGFFVEASASREWEITEKLSASLTGIFGVNQGYVADGHDGANHVAASWGWTYALTDSLSLGLHTTYSWGLDREPGATDDAALKDFFHAGVGLEWSF